MTISPGFDVSRESDEISLGKLSIFDVITGLNDGWLEYSDLTDEQWGMLEKIGFDLSMRKAYVRRFATRSEAGRYAANMRWHGTSSPAVSKKPKGTGEQVSGRSVSEWRDRFDAARSSGEPIEGLDEFIDGFGDLGECMKWVKENGEQLGLMRKPPDVLSRDVVDEVSVMEEAVRLRYRARENREYQWKRKAEIDKGEDFRAVDRRVQSGIPVVAVHADGARGLLADGRLKSQFESGRSSGAYSPHFRAAWETSAMGIHPGVDPQKRPIYGYMANDSSDVAQPLVSQYGDLRLELKPSVFGRTTLTNGDSLGSDADPIPLRSPNVNPRRVSDAEGSFGGYTEAQIHGPVSLSDVAMVHVPVSKADAFGDITKKFEDAGIQVAFY